MADGVAAALDADGGGVRLLQALEVGERAVFGDVVRGGERGAAAAVQSDGALGEMGEGGAAHGAVGAVESGGVDERVESAAVDGEAQDVAVGAVEGAFGVGEVDPLDADVVYAGGEADEREAGGCEDELVGGEGVWRIVVEAAGGRIKPPFAWGVQLFGDVEGHVFAGMVLGAEGWLVF